MQTTEMELSLIPILRDGSKSPPLKWAEYQQQRATEQQIEQWASKFWLAVVCGEVSGNLIVTDFDDANFYREWITRIDALYPAIDLSEFPTVQTPSGGYHIYLRLDTKPPGNLKLAWKQGDGNKQIAIETRGEGGYALVPWDGHDNDYELIGGPFIEEAPCVADEVWEAFREVAQSLNEVADASGYDKPTKGQVAGDRPGDQFNESASWKDILEPAGWAVVRAGEATLWRRPGKERGISATTGYCSSECSGDLLYVFSSNAAPLEPDRCYSKFAAFALLHCNGDFAAATRRIAVEVCTYELQAEIHDGAEPPGDKFAAFLENDRQFKNWWNNKDLGERSQLSRDFTGVGLMFRCGWSDQEIVDTLVAWYRKCGVGVPTAKHIACILEKIRQGKPERRATRELEIESVEPQDYLADINDRLGVDIEKIIRRGKLNPDYFFVIDREETEVGSSQQLFNQNRVRAILADSAGIVTERLKLWEWDVLVQRIVWVAQKMNQDEDKLAGLIDEGVRIYLHESQVFDDKAEAIAARDPFLADGRTYVYLASIRETIERVLGHSIDHQKLGRRMAAAGWVRRPETARFNGRHFCRSYYSKEL